MTIGVMYFADSPMPASQHESANTLCIANISPLERNKRLNFAVWQFVVTLCIFGAMLVLGLNPLWRLGLLFLFSASTVSFFQARDKT